MNFDTQRLLTLAARVRWLCLCLILPLSYSNAIAETPTYQSSLEILWRTAPDDREWPILVKESQKANVEEFIGQWSRVISALGTSPLPALAGAYGAETSEVGGTALRIHPEAGYVLANFYTCFPKVRKLSFGSVRLTPEGAELYPKAFLVENSQTGVLEPLAVSRINLVAGRWGDFQLLVQESELDNFFDYTAGLGEHNSAVMTADLWGLSVFSRSLTESVQQYGPPKFPQPYAKRVRPPIEGHITWVGRPQRVGSVDDSSLRYLVPVRVDIGSSGEVQKEMVFWVRGTASYPDESLQLTISKVMRGSVAGSVEVWREGDIGLIKKGLQVSTSRYPWGDDRARER